MARIVTCAAEDRLVRIAAPGGGIRQPRPDILGKLQRRRGYEFLHSDVADATVIFADLGDPVALLDQHVRGRVAHVDREMHMARYHRYASRPDLEPSDRESHFVGLVGEGAAHRNCDIGRGDESVAPARDRLGAGMRLLARDVYPPAPIALHPGDHTDHFAGGLQFDALLDMALEKGTDRFTYLAAPGLGDCCLQFVQACAQRNSVCIDLIHDLVQCPDASIDRRAHAGRVEARSFLVVPDDQHQRRQRDNRRIVDGFHRFQCRQRALHAVEPSGHRLAIGMRARRHRRQILDPGSYCEHVADIVQRHRPSPGQRDVGDQPVTRDILGRQRHAVHAARRCCAEPVGFQLSRPEAPGVDLDTFHRIPLRSRL